MERETCCLLNFEEVKAFLESWGLHFDTPDGYSDIPYPQVYERMKTDAGNVGGSQLQKFISCNTDTTDGRTYLCALSWEEVQEAWEKRQ